MTSLDDSKWTISHGLFSLWNPLKARCSNWSLISLTRRTITIEFSPSSKVRSHLSVERIHRCRSTEVPWIRVVLAEEEDLQISPQAIPVTPSSKKTTFSWTQCSSQGYFWRLVQAMHLWPLSMKRVRCRSLIFEHLGNSLSPIPFRLIIKSDWKTLSEFCWTSPWWIWMFSTTSTLEEQSIWNDIALPLLLLRNLLILSLNNSLNVDVSHLPLFFEIVILLVNTRRTIDVESVDPWTAD